MVRAWLRVVRLRFMAASAIAVLAGLALAWRGGAEVDAPAAALTMAGVAALHASVDMLNDYWDHRRGIDAAAPRTGLSGGTGVLPDGLLRPGQVRAAGLAALAAGAAIGAYLAAHAGPPVAALLAFAVVSVYFYSTRIVDSGLAEASVAAKGACIVAGAFYIQAHEFTAGAALAGAAVGMLSATVLLAASFPDREADRAGGRRTLVIAAGPRLASRLFWAFPAAAYAALAAGAASGHLPPASLAALAAAPLAALAGLRLRRHCADPAALAPAVSAAVWFARAAGALLVAGVALPWPA